MERIRERDLADLVYRINEITNSPLTTYGKKAENGTYQSNIGNYHVDYAYGGVTLHQIVNEHGGVNAVFGLGYMTKRDLYNRMRAFLEGLNAK